MVFPVVQLMEAKADRSESVRDQKFTAALDALKALFPAGAHVALNSCQEMTLTANQPLTAAPQVSYNVTGVGVVTNPVIPPFDGDHFTIGPMQIRVRICFVFLLSRPRLPAARLTLSARRPCAPPQTFMCSCTYAA